MKRVTRSPNQAGASRWTLCPAPGAMATRASGSACHLARDARELRVALTGDEERRALQVGETVPQRRLRPCPMPRRLLASPRAAIGRRIPRSRGEHVSRQRSWLSHIGSRSHRGTNARAAPSIRARQFVIVAPPPRPLRHVGDPWRRALEHERGDEVRGTPRQDRARLFLPASTPARWRCQCQAQCDLAQIIERAMERVPRRARRVPRVAVTDQSTEMIAERRRARRSPATTSVRCQ